MQELLNFILKKITNYPNEVVIDKEENTESGILIFNIRVHSEDIALVIGKNGKVIKSIRNLINVIALPRGTRVQLNVVEKQ